MNLISNPAHDQDSAPASHMYRATRRRTGFSLVEVVLAIGVVAFGIVALLGMLTLSTGLSRNSDQDTMLATMSRQVTSELRNTAFASLPPTGTILYFDADGTKLTSNKGAIYQCQINLTADTSYKSSDSTQNLYQVRLVFASALVPSASSGATPPPGSPSAPLLIATTALSRND